MGMNEMVILSRQGKFSSHLENQGVMMDRLVPARRMSVSVREIASVCTMQVNLSGLMMKKLRLE
jgi:hypothetical protein